MKLRTIGKLLGFFLMVIFSMFLIGLLISIGFEQLNPHPIPLDQVSNKVKLEWMERMAKDPYYRPNIIGDYYLPNPSLPGAIMCFIFAAFFLVSAVIGFKEEFLEIKRTMKR